MQGLPDVRENPQLQCASESVFRRSFHARILTAECTDHGWERSYDHDADPEVPPFGHIGRRQPDRRDVRHVHSSRWLAAPEIDRAGTNQEFVTPAIEISWEPVAGAVLYRAQISVDGVNHTADTAAAHPPIPHFTWQTS